jgi:putative zinc finger/helix-turn-helix YgiT family protein
MPFPWPPGSECPVCGKREMTVTCAPIEDEVEGRTYLVEGLEYNRCAACGEDFYNVDQLDDIYIAGSALARADLGRLAPDEIRGLRLALDLTQAGLEAQLGVSAGTVGRWERGTFVPGATADRLMRILAAHPELLAEVGAHVAPGGAMVARESRGPYRKSGKPRKRDAS